MIGTPKWDRVFATASWVIVASLLFAAFAVMFISVPGASGPVAGLIGAVGAKWFYFFLYLGEGLTLGYSKIRKKKELRKHTLVAVYVTGAFTSLLTFASVGFSPKVIDNVIFTVVSAGCWLYWKFKTEYVDYSFFEQDIDELRPDPSPSRQSKD